MGFAPEAVKLRIANVGGFHRLRSAAASPLKTPRKQIYSRQLRRFKEPRLRHRATLTKTGRSRISPPTVRDGPVQPGAAHLGPQMVHFGPVSITGLISIQRQLARSAENYP